MVSISILIHKSSFPNDSNFFKSKKSIYYDLSDIYRRCSTRGPNSSTLTMLCLLTFCCVFFLKKSYISSIRIAKNFNKQTSYKLKLPVDCLMLRRFYMLELDTWLYCCSVSLGLFKIHFFQIFRKFNSITNTINKEKKTMLFVACCYL